MNQYGRGRRLEYKVRDELKADGYEVLRTAGSKGALDLLAIKPQQWLFVQVKGNGVLAPAGWNRLYDLALMADAIPVLAECLPARPTKFYRLTARKVGRGRQPYEPFSLDLGSSE